KWLGRGKDAPKKFAESSEKGGSSEDNRQTLQRLNNFFLGELGRLGKALKPLDHANPPTDWVGLLQMFVVPYVTQLGRDLHTAFKNRKAANNVAEAVRHLPAAEQERAHEIAVLAEQVANATDQKTFEVAAIDAALAAKTWVEKHEADAKPT